MLKYEREEFPLKSMCIFDRILRGITTSDNFVPWSFVSYRNKYQYGNDLWEGLILKAFCYRIRFNLLGSNLPILSCMKNKLSEKT